MTETKRHVSDYLLERFVLSELPAATMKEIRELAEKDSDLRDRIEAIHASNEAILAEFDVAEMTAAIKHRAHVEELEHIEKRHFAMRNIWKPILIGAPILAALIATVIVKPFPIGGGTNYAVDPLEVTRIKGIKPFLFVYRQNGDKIEMLTSGAAAKENDVLQISYVASQAPYGVIVSLDGRGVVTPHLPNNVTAPDTSTTLKPAGETFLPYAYKLDDAPKFEVFFFVVSLRPIDVRKVIDAASKLNVASINPAEVQDGLKLDLPADEYSQSSFIVRKEDQ